MLRLMRDHASSWIIKFLLGAIVIVFVFWGVGSWSTKKSNRVATVNGDPINLDEYREAYTSLLEQLRQRFGNNLNEEMMKMFRVDRQALNSLIDKKIVFQEAKRLNFRVPDSELTDAIERMGSFQRAGVFDVGLYQKVLNRYRMTPEEFEFDQRELILVNKLRSFITGSIKVSDQEAMEWYNWINTSIDLDFVLFEPDIYTDVDASEEEIKKYFDGHKLSYKTERMRKARYLHFNPDAYTSQVQITEEEIRDYFEANRNEFKTPKTIEARHIIIKVDSEANTTEVEEARLKAFDVYNMVKEGGDFAELAKTHSEGPSRDSGGYLGTFEKKEMVKPFADKAFSMKAGEISEPIRTQFGWHIIKVEKVNEASSLSFETAAPKIRTKLSGNRAESLAYDDAEAVYEASFDVEDLTTIAQARNLTVTTTDFFTSMGPDKGIKNRTQFASEAFKLLVMEISEPKDPGDGYYILQVIEEIPERVPEFESVAEKAKADLLTDKQDEKARNDAAKFLSALKNGNSMIEEGKKYNLKLETTGFFKRNESIPKIGFEQEIAKAVFKLTGEKDLMENVIKGKKGYLVIRLKERKSPAPEGFESAIANIKKVLLEQKQIKAFEGWLSKVKDRSEISIEKDFLQ